MRSLALAKVPAQVRPQDDHNDHSATVVSTIKMNTMPPE